MYLNLDPAVSVPIVLGDVSKASESFLNNIDSKARNPAGKFYKEQYAIALADTLRTEGSYAKISIQDGVDDEQKKHFDRFVSRIQGGELVWAFSQYCLDTNSYRRAFSSSK